MDSLLQMAVSQSYMPHGVCYLWTPGLVWLHVVSDGLIALAYFVIPLTLLYVVIKRDDLPFNWLILLFGVFIVACGATHVMEVWNVWHGDYWESGAVKAVTALASVPTAIVLVHLVPKILSLPSRADLQDANRRLELANQELEQFAYAVSHDLRAPLRAVEGFGQALEQRMGGDLDHKSRHYVSRMRESSDRMATLIDDLLDLSRLAREHVTYEEVDVSAMAERLVADMRDADRDRDVTARIQPGMRATCDAALLRVALDNLLRNAWKFTKDRDEAVIEVGESRTAGGKAHFYVRDNGAGFDMRYSEKLFAIFQRLHTSTEFPGNGVGLATVQKIVNRHGGEIWANGRKGEGATFCFTLA